MNILSTFPTVPDFNSSEFRKQIVGWLNAEYNSVDEINSVTSDIEDKQDTFETYENTSETNKTTIAGYKTTAETDISYQGSWTSGENYTRGQIVKYSGVYYLVKNNITNSTTNPTSDTTNFKALPIDTKTIGNINNPIFYAPLKNNLRLVNGTGSITFTNSTTTRTYVDRYGILKTAAADEPRFEKDGLLIEGSSTNLIYPSEDLTDSSWTKYYVENPPTTTTTAPDDSSIAYLVKEDTSNNIHRIYRSVSLTAGEKYTISIFAKPNGRKYLHINAVVALNARATYYLNNEGSITEDSSYTPISTKITKLANGWYRCEITGEAQLDNAIIFFQLNTSSIAADDYYTGDGSSGIYMWGAQLEKKPFATSYIPTTSASATRNADVCYVPFVNNIPNTYNSALSICCDFKTLFNDSISGISNPYLFGGYNSNVGYLACYFSSATLLKTLYRNSSIYVNGSFTPGIKNRMCFTINNDNEAKLYLNGELKTSAIFIYTLTSQNYPTYFYIGDTYSLNHPLYGHISNLKIYDFALSEQEAQLA